MANGPNLAIRFNESDQQALAEVSQRLQRSKSDTLRVLVRTALVVLREQAAGVEQPGIQDAAASSQQEIRS
jgi:hypothetical protein